MTRPPQTENRRILVVDDNESIHTDFRKILIREPSDDAYAHLRATFLGDQTQTIQNCPSFEIDSAMQGAEGLQMVITARQQGRPYALAFVDMRMPPGWDGLETIEQIWKEDPDLHVVICSAFADYSWDGIQERLGVTDRLLLLKKPFDCAEVAQLASALTAKWNAMQLARLRQADLEEMVARRTDDLRIANDGLRQEMVSRRKAEKQLRHFVLHDPLTKLPNRILLNDRLERCIERMRRGASRGFAVLFLDLDNFKLINDTLGHNTGDELLVQIARRLVAGLRSVDTVARRDTNSQSVANEVPTNKAVPARLGGDEFVILLEDVFAARDAVRVAERIHEALSMPFSVAGGRAVVSASIGIRLAEPDDTTPEVVLRDADIAMYRAKQAGTGQHALFDAAMHRAVKARLELENSLRSGIGNGAFKLVFQPIVALHGGCINGYEALLRWGGTQTFVVEETIRVAEETGLIVPLGEWILDAACRQVRRWNSQGIRPRPVTVSVNVSKRQLADEGFCTMVEQTLKRHHVPPQWLNMEVTESTVIQADATVLSVLNRLKQLGIGLHMDDFGTGYSSLSCLHRIPFDVLKIDRAFVSTGSVSRQCALILDAIIALAKNLNMAVIAEGVETADDLERLVALNCDYAQGYYFSPPVEAQEADRFLAQPVQWPEEVERIALPEGEEVNGNVQVKVGARSRMESARP